MSLGNSVLQEVIHYLFGGKAENVLKEAGEGDSLVVALNLSSVVSSGPKHSHHAQQSTVVPLTGHIRIQW